ncbi:MAG: Bpu10I family restriction endonuclease [Candidatus Magnetoovum sp. WYHC-5]|nr:Bpu10I family restriction endonuclease [Candidatus Magnetoovum sp. WYHC-5]
MEYPTPHYEKLKALFENDKLPNYDKERIDNAITMYKQWRNRCLSLSMDEKNVGKLLQGLVDNLNQYKNYIDICLIFDSEQDFLYRQKGQLKLDNTIIEEFLPFLINDILIPQINSIDITIGPMSTFSSAYFVSTLKLRTQGGGLSIRTKNQDFAISRRLYLKTSHSPDFPPSDSAIQNTYIAYVAAECKTNLDKTMFQEACTTAHDIKTAVSGAKYFLLIEWLDMTPLSTTATDIDEVILLRKAKRLNSNIRQYYALSKHRKEKRNEYVSYIENNPFRLESFERFLSHIRELLDNDTPNEHNVLDMGYF